MAGLEPRNFLQPCLLLLLCEQPDHGYELAARLRPMHDGEGEAGGVYRALRGLERQGLVRSEWHTSDTGPARRTYFVTEEGVASLVAQAAELEQAHSALHAFHDRYRRLQTARESRESWARNGNGRKPDDAERPACLGNGRSVHGRG